MSRSYRKTPCGKIWKFVEAVIRKEILGDADMGIPNWSKTRMKENNAVHDELTNPGYGDAVFPKYRGADKNSWFSISLGHPLQKEYIRIRYCKEIRNIINGYHDEKENYEELFIEAYNRIKNGKCPDGKVSRFAWLNTREAKEAVKQWEGDPPDVLYYLTHSGIIEKAVRNECRRMLRK